MSKKRVTLYVDVEEYKQLRSKLMLLGKTVTSWLKESIKRTIKELDEIQ